MPEVKVAAPEAVVSADRLTLGALDARGALAFQGEPASPWGCSVLCLAEE